MAIKILAGDATGNMMVGHRDFEIGNNMKTKVFFGHFTLYSTPIIHHPGNIYIAYDIFVKGCAGGAGVKFWNHTNKNIYNPSNPRTLVKADKFAIMVSYEEERISDFQNPLDCSGYFTYAETRGLIPNYEITNRPHYSTAGWYNGFWNYRPLDSLKSGSIPIIHVYHPWHEKDTNKNMGYNTLMWHGAESYYNKESGKYDNLKLNTGHWGGTGSGPGARDIRNGVLRTIPSSLLELKATICF
jgi:hypothetical protein